MEQHPVPQNVTTFQFRLIGDMTLKQFGYLCAGAILAFIAYKLPLPFIITWPLSGAFAFLGVGFAFIPIEERPMDVWVFSFFKSIYSPTQYIWSHTEESRKVAPQPPKAAASNAPAPVATPPPQQQVAPRASALPQAPSPSPTVAAAPPARPATPKSVLSGLFQPAPTSSPQPAPAAARVVRPPHASFVDEIMSMFRPKPKQVSPPVNAPTAPPMPSVTGRHVAPPAPAAAHPQPAVPTPEEMAMQQRMKQLEEIVSTLEGRLATKSVTEDRVLELQKQLTQVLADKSKTEEELVSLKRAAPTAPNPPPQATETQAPPPRSEVRGSVNVITTQEGAVKVGLPKLTNSPNVVTGLVKDDTGNLLPGILVTVTNSEGIPVRALKTNKLGQFAASTQLPNGVYFVEVEDPRGRFTFTRVQITLNGTVVPVLEIIAKSEKALTREKLAQEIFGKTNL